MAEYPGNFVDSGIKTVPNRLRTASNAPTTKLAYITPEEEGILQALKPGTPHKGPMGIPNYDSIDWNPNTGQMEVTTGEQASAMEAVTGGYGGQSDQNIVDAMTTGQTEAYETSKPGGWSEKEKEQSIKDKKAGKPWAVQDGQWVAPDEKPIETKPPKKDDNWVEDAWKTIQKAGGIFTSIPVAFFKKLAHPEMEDFKDPKFLAVIDRLFKEKNKELGAEGGEQFKKDYVADYKKLMDEAFAGNEAMLAQGLSSEEFFNQQLEEASDLSKMGELGKGSQRINFPEEYYEGVKEKTGLPQTIGELEDLAKLDATKYPGTDLAQMIFDARAELDRQQGAGGGGGGGGIPSIPLPVPDPSDPTPDPDPIDLTPTPTIPPGTTLTPTPFDYSQWPQFTSAYPGYNQYSWPNYVNQGLGQWPNFDYWNQIANTFPGMGNYG